MPLYSHSGKRVLNPDAGDVLPSVQILREDPGRAALQCAGDDESIPESYARLVLDAKCT